MMIPISNLNFELNGTIYAVVFHPGMGIVLRRMIHGSNGHTWTIVENYRTMSVER
jgi:hypothetical protein